MRSVPVRAVLPRARERACAHEDARETRARCVVKRVAVKIVLCMARCVAAPPRQPLCGTPFRHAFTQTER